MHAVRCNYGYIFNLGQFSLVNICKINLFSSYIFNIFISASVIHQTMIAWERYLAIRKWMDYKNIATKSRLKKLATLSWLFAIFLGFPIPSPKSGTTLLFILDFVKGLFNFVGCHLLSCLNLILLPHGVSRNTQKEKKHRQPSHGYGKTEIRV